MKKLMTVFFALGLSVGAHADFTTMVRTKNIKFKSPLQLPGPNLNTDFVDLLPVRQAKAQVEIVEYTCNLTAKVYKAKTLCTKSQMIDVYDSRPYPVNTPLSLNGDNGNFDCPTKYDGKDVTMNAYIFVELQKENRFGGALVDMKSSYALGLLYNNDFTFFKIFPTGYGSMKTMDTKNYVVAMDASLEGSSCSAGDKKAYWIEARIVD